VVSGSEGEVGGITFSPDGNYLYYAKHEPGTGLGTLYQVASLGGAPRQLIMDVDSPVSFSPDGERIVFVRQSTAARNSSLMAANADGTGQKPVVVVKYPASFAMDGPSWSPDGKRIAIGKSLKGDFQSFILETVEVDTGAEARVGSREWDYMRQSAWLPDGSAIIFGSAAEKTSFNAQLWEVSYPRGEERRITNDLNNYLGTTITSDGSTLATVKLTYSGSLWVGSFGGATGFSAPKQITSGISRADGLKGLVWPTADQIVYTYFTSGALKVASASPDGNNVHDFATSTGTAVFPSACGDGQHLVLSVAGRSNGFNVTLWRSDLTEPIGSN